jgi:hypothetical protein
VLLSKSAAIPLNVKVLPVRLNKLLVFSITATDADAGDTFTYTLVTNSAAYFAIDGNSDGLFGVFIISIACGGFNFDGVRFCVTFKVGGDTVEC